MKLIYFRHNHQVEMNRIPPMKTYYTDLTLLLRGSMEYVVDGENVILRDGDVLFLKKGTLLSRNTVSNADYISFNFLFEESDIDYELPVVIKNGISKDINLLLSACDEIYSSTDNIATALILLVQCILTQLQNNLSRKHYHPLTVEIMHYVSVHLNESISLSQIADATFFSASYCSFVFRQDTKTSILNYILEEKIKEAKRLINDKIPLKQIAEMLSFTDYNYFSRIFKKHAGCSPIAYKKEQMDHLTLYQEIQYKQPITARYFADTKSSHKQHSE